MNNRDIPVSYLRECFALDSQTGVLTWKARPQSHFFRAGQAKHFATNYAGKPAGRIKETGYFHLTLAVYGKYFKLLNHRIVWALLNDAWPLQVIDHINRVRTDNRPCNLRDVSQAVNMANRSVPYANPNPTGVVGVTRTRGGAYRAYMYGGRKQINLGTFHSLSEAAAARTQAQERRP